MSLFRRKNHYALKVGVLADTAVGDDKRNKKITRAIIDARPRGLSWKMSSSDQMVNDNGETFVEHEAFFDGSCGSPEAALDEWLTSIGAVKGVEKVMQMSFKGNDGTKLYYFDDEILEIEASMTDEDREALQRALNEVTNAESPTTE